MIVTSQLQSRQFCEDEFGFGTFGWVPVGKVEIERILTKIIHSETEVKLIVISRTDKAKTGLWRSKNEWSKAQGGSKNIFFDPEIGDHSISMIASSIMSNAIKLSDSKVPVLAVESEVLQYAKADTALNPNIKLDNIKIICY